MRRYPVTTRVNNVTNDDRGCSEPIEVSGGDSDRTFLMNDLFAFGSVGRANRRLCPALPLRPPSFHHGG